MEDPTRNKKDGCSPGNAEPLVRASDKESKTARIRAVESAVNLSRGLEGPDIDQPAEALDHLKLPKETKSLTRAQILAMPDEETLTGPSGFNYELTDFVEPLNISSMSIGSAITNLKNLSIDAMASIMKDNAFHNLSQREALLVHKPYDTYDRAIQRIEEVLQEIADHSPAPANGEEQISLLAEIRDLLLAKDTTFVAPQAQPPEAAKRNKVHGNSENARMRVLAYIDAVRNLMKGELTDVNRYRLQTKSGKHVWIGVANALIEHWDTARRFVPDLPVSPPSAQQLAKVLCSAHNESPNLFKCRD